MKVKSMITALAVTTALVTGASTSEADVKIKLESYVTGVNTPLAMVQPAGDDRKFVIEQIKERTGHSARILSGEKEAEYIYRGVMKTLHLDTKNSVIADIGGGSTELIVTDSNAETTLKSLNAGAVWVTEGFLHNDPPADEDIERARAAFREMYEEGDMPHNLPGCQLIGVGGTITTFAAIKEGLKKYDRSRVHDSVLDLNDIENIFAQLRALPLLDRKKVDGLEPGRADIIIGGAIIILFIMERFAATSIRVSDDGILIGLLI